MIVLYFFAGFFMTIVSIMVGYTFGYQAGFKNDKTLKQQISKLKGTIKKQNESKQLRELTVAELKARDDYDFRSKLAAITGVPMIQPDSPKDDDPASMDRMFS